MKKFIYVLGLMVMIYMFSAVSLLAADRYVNATTGNNVPGGGNELAPWKTIQYAITNSGINDVIHVAADVYHERLVIDKSLTLQGAQSGVDPTLPGARTNPDAETIINLIGLSVPNPNVLVEIPLGVKNVVISGFTLDGKSALPQNADFSTIRCWDDNLTIEDNIIDGFYCVLYKGNDYFAVNRNRITANKVGITVQPSPATFVTISDNIIVPGIPLAPDAQGIYFTGVNTATVSGNTITGFAASNGLGGSSDTNLTISGNTLLGNKKGISFWGNTTFITMERNTIRGSIVNGIEIKGQDILITGNQIQNSASDGICVDNHTLTTERVTISNNCITGNTNFGLRVTSGVSMPVDALDNWWGSATGPFHAALNSLGTGDTVSDRAIFSPWLTSIAYTGETSFAHFDPVILQAMIDTSAGPISGNSIRFYADGNFVHEATTDASGVASYDWGLQPVGSYSVQALAAGGCLASAPTTIEVKQISLIADFQITEAKLDWKKKPEDDKARVKGVFVLPDTATPDPNAVILKIGKVTFGPIVMTKVDDKKWEYKHPKGTTGIKDMKIEWKKKEAKFEIHIDDADLGEMGTWSNPVTISLLLGSYMGTANVPMVEHKDKWEYHK